MLKKVFFSAGGFEQYATPNTLLVTNTKKIVLGGWGLNSIYATPNALLVTHTQTSAFLARGFETYATPNRLPVKNMR